ncbi:MAG: T9SS type A sorting domain-containing protein [Saprospiraceae bacterium]
MKFFNHIILLFAILFSIPTQAESLHHSTEKALFDHLTEVNQQWKYQYDLSIFDFRQMVGFNNDNQRIQTHLQFVYRLLSSRSTTHLNKIQTENRQKHLAVLKSYYEAAIFPTNHYHTKRQPYFVDNFEVHCAVGYLLQQDGQNELIATIRKNDNYAYIHELTKYSQIEIWAKANGFTVDELALIQPGYGPVYEFSAIGNGVDGEVLCFEKSDDENTLFIGGNFTTIDGIASASVASFDGTNFQAIGGISGSVHDMKYHNGDLYVVGDFSINQTPTNVAVWDGTTWTALQNGDMQGTVYAIEILWTKLYIGGDFQKINNVDMSYLAYYELGTQQWSTDGRAIIGGSYQVIPDGFSVDAPVYDLEIVNNMIAIGGEFMNVAPNVMNPNFNTFNTSFFAYWNYTGEWVSGFNTPNGIVNSIRYINGNLYIGSLVSNASSILSVLSAGIWSYTYSLGGYDDFKIHDFIEHNGKIYTVGGVTHLPFVGTHGQGILGVSHLGNMVNVYGVGVISSSVKAATTFQDKAYFGGSFDSISVVEVNGLTVSDLDGVSNTENIEEQKNYAVWYATNHIIIESKQAQPTDFTLFNVNGQVVNQVQNINTNRHEIPISDLPKGIYFYKVNSENGAMSGKLAVY